MDWGGGEIAIEIHCEAGKFRQKPEAVIKSEYVDFKKENYGPNKNEEFQR